jgi:hypothetical protein
MYKVVHISSNIVAVTFNERAYAVDWMTENNNLNGEPANLYKLIKAKA